jgi:hypothetical protein
MRENVRSPDKIGQEDNKMLLHFAHFMERTEKNVLAIFQCGYLARDLKNRGSLSSYPFMGKSEAYTLEKRGGGSPLPTRGGGDARFWRVILGATNVHDRVSPNWLMEKI